MPVGLCFQKSTIMQIDIIYNECCLDTMKRLQDQSVHLCVTSPPYNMRLRVRNGKYTTREKADHFSKKYEHFSDDLPIGEYFEFHVSVISELLRVCKTVVWNIGIVTGSKEAGFKIIGRFSENIKDVVVWDKGHGEPAMHEGVINRATEIILIMESGASPGRALSNYNFKRGEIDDIWRVKRPKTSKKIKKKHRATMPETLAGMAINYFSRPGEIVFDPFGGVGTTGVVAKKYDRKFIMSEISLENYIVAMENVGLKTSQKRLFY